MRWLVRPARIEGHVGVPGDKSIGHRAVMLASLAAGDSRISNLPAGEDVQSTARCMGALGVDMERSEGRTVVHGPARLSSPADTLDAGNSGTTTRLLAGILAGQPFQSRLTGDASLRRRPMTRVVEPLASMGARIETCDGRVPLDITGGALHGATYSLPIPSAQVKSAILLAGLFASGETVVHEPVRSRDHTERMLAALGVPVVREGNCIRVQSGRPAPFSLVVPGDLSSASFFFAAAAITGGEVTVHDVGINPTRAGFLDLLGRMGASIRICDRRVEAGEPIADVTVSASALHPVLVEGPEVPLLVDEIPLVALLASQADGESRITGAAELRHKETDRIATVAAALSALGADVTEQPDGFTIRGPRRLHGVPLNSHGDHRIAMMLAVAACVATGQTSIGDAEVAAVSYPTFVDDFARLGAQIDYD